MVVELLEENQEETISYATTVKKINFMKKNE